MSKVAYNDDTAMFNFMFIIRVALTSQKEFVTQSYIIIIFHPYVKIPPWPRFRQDLLIKSCWKFFLQNEYNIKHSIGFIFICANFVNWMYYFHVMAVDIAPLSQMRSFMLWHKPRNNMIHFVHTGKLYLYFYNMDSEIFSSIYFRTCSLLI